MAGTGLGASSEFWDATRGQTPDTALFFTAIQSGAPLTRSKLLFARVASLLVKWNGCLAWTWQRPPCADSGEGKGQGSRCGGRRAMALSYP